MSVETDRRDDNGDRDRIDELREWLDARYRRVTGLLLGLAVLLLLTAIAGTLSIRANQSKINAQQQRAMVQRKALARNQVAIQEGRKLSLRVVCAATTAVIEAGRATITGGADLQPQTFARNLERLGFPPLRRRKRAAALAAATYANLIATRIGKETGVEDVVKPNGALNCDRLLSLARTP